jgi:hypothetical protein
MDAKALLLSPLQFAFTAARVSERYHIRADVERGLDRGSERQNAMQYFALLRSELGHQRRISNIRGWSGYPPKLSVKADIPDGQISASSGH